MFLRPLNSKKINRNKSSCITHQKLGEKMKMLYTQTTRKEKPLPLSGEI